MLLSKDRRYDGENELLILAKMKKLRNPKLFYI